VEHQEVQELLGFQVVSSRKYREIEVVSKLFIRSK
jgi:hypothetical protein